MQVLITINDYHLTMPTLSCSYSYLKYVVNVNLKIYKPDFL